ncbi:hypothetical protein H6P81_021261 [Aristolochia fimbriata]|uniref:DNA-directed RNA polymerase n=1 Tax=Aristolochia fimbriata TaxID=158543 RepID=A0AAV7DT06_ARIFI|nr:hypothetical protein H6P81_021261 [Aristolochia fimbriata]
MLRDENEGMSTIPGFSQIQFEGFCRFIDQVNGIYRIVINQILQSPGIYYRSELDHNGIAVYTGTIISDWGGRWGSGIFESLCKELQKKFFQQRCELGRIGRRNMNRRLNLDIPQNNIFLLPRDILAAADHLIGMKFGMGTLDDMNHLKNKRIRSVADLLQDQLGLALVRLENVVRGTICGAIRHKLIPTPQNLVTSTPLTTTYESFFGLHPLSQVLDRTNPLTQIVHGRKLSYLGPGGLTGRTASFRIRDIHPSHYGRICPIDTSEGINVGLIGSLAIHARIGHWGSIESPFLRYLRDLKKHRSTGNSLALNRDIQEEQVVPARYRQEFLTIAWEQIHLRSIFPFQYFSIGASLIPFIEHNDANRALMSSNMQRQAVPLSRSEKCIVGTGLERQAALDSGVSAIAECEGKIVYTDTDKIVLSGNGDTISIPLVMYQRSNKNTCMHQKPQAPRGKCIKKGQILAGGAATVGGELALGKNVLVAYMPWEGYNFEDAVLISERLAYADIYTSFHIRKYEIQTHVTSQGPERITKEIPHLEAHLLRNLDRNGIVMLGSWVETGDILVGKLTPQAAKESSYAPEDRLLRAILGIQKREIKVGDKVAGRHGNKGIISKILPRQDMPYLQDGTPVDMVFNPLGVPSRMNVGQIFECSLGLAGNLLGRHYRIAPFDERYEQEASRKLVFSELYEASKQTANPWVFEPEYPGKSRIFDGRTGDPFEQPVIIGKPYILKLIHQVDDKIHGRSSGHYALVTQQPLRGRAKQGDNEFGMRNCHPIQSDWDAPDSDIEISTGASAIREQLADLDLRIITDHSLAEWKELGEEGPTGNEWEDRKIGRRKDFLVRRIELAKHFIRTNVEPEWMVLCLLPVLPPELRPIIQIDGGAKREDFARLYLVNESIIRGAPSLLWAPLSLHQCGLPREIAIELFQTFLIRGLIRQHLASNIGIAKSKIRENKPIVWEILQEVMQGHPVLLNRAPTLHRLGIQAFQPILVEGRAICLHPLVRKGFNADFDGDQMAVHVPLSFEAQAEAHLLMFSHMNLLSPAIGDPISVPTQDMLMGLYILTIGNRRGICANRYNPWNRGNYENKIGGDNNYKYTKEKEPYFCSSYDALGAYRQKRINLDSPLWLRWRLDQRVIASRELPIEVQYESSGTYHEIYGHFLIVKSVKKEILCIYIRTTVGHISFYREIEEAIQGLLGSTGILIPEFLRESRSRKGSLRITDSTPLSNPTQTNMEVLMAERPDLVFHNKVIDGTAMKRLISRLIDHFGMAYTSHILDQVKTLGFRQATATSISLGIDDLLTIPSKGWLVQDAEQQSLILEKHHHYGNVHAVEKLRQSIEIWYATSEYLRQEMHLNFRMTDPSNPVHIMSFSGARGNASQVHQLVGMRGLMSDPQGQMIDLPIQSNLREGLSLTEYIISCYGARKGVVDTAVRTSDAGYLTRRLVEVVQHIVVRRTDCGTIRGISVSPQNGMTEKMLIQTLIGRVLADDVYMGLRCIAARNQDIGIGLVNRFITFQAQPIYIRTPFTCRSTSWICRLCYGRSPTHGDLVELGEAVGIIAGQSIGEPGTQLTLRTFHTGGVFTGGTAEQERDNVQLQVVNYILYMEGKPIRGISHTNIQLVRTCLVLNWDQGQNSSIEEVHASFVEVRTNDLIRNFIRIDLVKSPISCTGKRDDRGDSGLNLDNGSDRTNINPFFPQGEDSITYPTARDYPFVAE